MPKTLPVRASDDEAPKKPSTANLKRIEDNVLRVLGQPDNLIRIQVKSLWGNFFRANIFSGSVDSPAVTHSYFLQATEEGEILKSTPLLIRVYSAN